MNKLLTPQTLTDLVRASALSDFYRTRWGSVQAFEQLPTTSRADFIAVPLSKRRYTDARGLVKIVHTPEGSFMSEWSFEDIGAEPWGMVGTRPLVFLSDPHEAVEKSMWCYENNRVPLIGEKDPDITMFAAGKYKIDSLITDTASLKLFAPYFKEHGPLSSISILGDWFTPEELLPFKDFAKNITLVLRLPETGALAVAPLTVSPIFTPVPGVHIEQTDTLIVTKLSLLATPLIRYKTGIPALGHA